MNKEYIRIAQAWIQNCRDAYTFGVSSTEAELTWWAYEELEQLIDKNPQQALEIILDILNLTDEDRVLDNLAAGPLESLLVKNGDIVIGNVVSLAKRDAKFYELLKGVWGNSIDESIWNEIKTLVQEIGHDR
ncbi:DUF6869 domain-containing protein [Methylomarinum vadi]|uniref:DUF6869 domain-containing protein n=1 Tax=Methylomarinum vadi TaxID=438855 RepID=UPI0004DF35E6|nr:hypothetical protein [Methylomarinum vadi]